jgi:transcriptional regulator with XRE-family HTH domain
VTFISEVENGRRKPGADTLLSLAEALGTSLDYLMKGVTNPDVTRKDLVVPNELAELAAEEHFSLNDVNDLLKADQMVVARRRRLSDSGADSSRRSKDDWRRLYSWLRDTPQ